jgi:hypothetical protein
MGSLVVGGRMPKPWNVAWAQSSNFGDALSPWVVQKLTGVTPFYVDSLSSDFEHYIVTGSVASAARRNSICWSPGVMWYYERPDRNATWLAVRGPLTRSAINTAGGKCPDIFGDPAILLPRYCPPSSDKKYDLSIIAHYIEHSRISAGGWIDVIIRDDIHFINVYDPIEKICKEISESKRIISSSLHGCIAADAYAVPWKWVKFTNNVGGDDCKFMDHFLAVGREDLSFIDLRSRVQCKEVLLDMTKNASFTPEDRMERMRERLMSCCPFSAGLIASFIG